MTDIGGERESSGKVEEGSGNETERSSVSGKIAQATIVVISGTRDALPSFELEFAIFEARLKD
jgi:hypothetical protein